MYEAKIALLLHNEIFQKFKVFFQSQIQNCNGPLCTLGSLTPLRLVFLTSIVELEVPAKTSRNNMF